MSVDINSELIHKAGNYVAGLFIDQLPKDLLFHNFQHTLGVVRGVMVFIKQLDLTEVDEEVLLLAAWFHDSGHIHSYEEHEKYSQQIAAGFLRQEEYPEQEIERVINCIAATKMPQQPSNILEGILCDADLYHLCLPGYIHLQKMLRKEWELVCNKNYSDKEWNLLNLQFLQDHEYHTLFAQANFQKKKVANIAKFKQLVYATS